MMQIAKHGEKLFGLRRLLAQNKYEDSVKTQRTMICCIILRYQSTSERTKFVWYILQKIDLKKVSSKPFKNIFE